MGRLVPGSYLGIWPQQLSEMARWQRRSNVQDLMLSHGNSRFWLAEATAYCVLRLVSSLSYVALLASAVLPALSLTLSFGTCMQIILRRGCVITETGLHVDVLYGIPMCSVVHY